MNLTVRAFQKDDFELMVDYFLNATLEFVQGMGADQSKLLEKDIWLDKLYLEFEKPNSKKENYYLLWSIDDKPVGHSNINHIEYGKKAHMHLHIWEKGLRKSGLGMQFVKKSIANYFENFELQILVCEPYAENIAPNKTLKRVGFQFVKTYETIPGAINFLQNVNRYEMTKELFETLRI